ncbi:MAG: SBBP repeat-containing protein [Bryobacteraceae bacterium]
MKFLARRSGYGLYLTADEAVLALRKGGCAGPPAAGACAHQADVVRMRLTGAGGGAAAPAGEDQLPGTANYFIGNEPAKWHTRVPTYAKVRYHGVYPGVDLVYYGNQRQLEYDFVVAPGADPKPIRLQFAGAKGLRLGADGDLVVTAAGGALAFHRPVVYQLVDGQRKAIKGSFALPAKNTVGFRVGSYDRGKPLVIDPVLVYSTYLGGSSYSGQSGFGDDARGLAVDGSGNAYVTGYTYSADFPVTQGAFQTTSGACSGCVAAFVTKLNPSGTALVYSTYLAASGGGAYANALAVDASGNAYIGGSARAGFPTTPGAFQTTNRSLPGGSNAFVTKLNPTGSALVYSTYLGGGTSYLGGDSATALAVDSMGNAYIAGVTYSSDFPVTAGAFQTGNNAGLASNAFVAKLNPAGGTLFYSTYLGGSGRIVFSFGPQVWEGDGATGLSVDSAGDAYISGYAYSTDFPVTVKAFQTTNRATVPYGSGGVAPEYNRSNAFVTKLNPAGTALVYSTYLGGSGSSQYGDSASGLAVDGSGNAYITGAAGSTDFPATLGALQTTNHSAAGNNAFLTKLNPTGSALVYSTYLGGSGNDAASGVAVDGSGNTYITGAASSADFPMTQGALQTTNRPAAGGNAFVAELNRAGSVLVYSTYLGGSGGDAASGVAVDGSGNAYITGEAGSTDFPVTPGAFQATNHSANSSSNAFVAKVDLNAKMPAPSITPGGMVPVDSTVGTIQPGEWVSIYGPNLASSTEIWSEDFPQSLDGTSVTIDGRAAYLSYVSPGQVNVQAPDDTVLGPVQVAVTTPGGTATATVTLAQFAPSFLLFDSKHVAGIILRSDGSGAYGGGAYDILGPTGASLGYSAVAARAGDIVELFGTGFGPTSPTVEAGEAFSGAAATTNAVNLLIHNLSVTPMWAGLSGAGLYQLNVTVPAGLGTGDVSLVATVGGAQTPQYVVISLQ